MSTPQSKPLEPQILLPPKLTTDEINSMTYNDLFEAHRDSHPVPEGKTYNQVVLQIQHLAKRLGFIPTKEQMHTILSRGVPLIIDATAGSGKTTVSEFILQCDTQIYGFDPQRILITTFSNQGVLSMQRKNIQFSTALNTTPIREASTMHSWYLAFLKEFKQYLNLGVFGNEDIKVITGMQTKQLLRQTMSSILNKVIDLTTLEDCHALYNYITHAMITEDRVAVERTPLFQKLDLTYAQVIAIQKAYDSTKALICQVDFTDMLRLMYKLLSENPIVQRRISGYFDRFLIDEFQDTNKLSFEVYKLLLNDKTRNNIMVVGDIDQSIYKWQGTSFNPFKDFQEDFPNSYLTTLTKNLRSGKDTVETANKLIGYNINRTNKQLTTPNTFADSVRPIPCNSRMEAINFISKELIDKHKELHQLGEDTKSFYTGTAVVARNHYQLLWLVDRLLEAGLSVNLLTDTFPYSDKIFNDTLDLLELLSYPTNADLASSVISKYIREYTDKHKDAIKVQMVSKKIPFYELKLDNLRKNSTFKDDMSTLKQLSENVNRLTVGDICKVLIPIYRSNSYDYYAKASNVDLEQSSLIFEYLIAQDSSPNKFAIKLSDIRKRLRYCNEMDLGIRVGSIHSVKGLEYKNMYLLDINGLNFPNPLTIEKYKFPHDFLYFEEERNLFYVAITRSMMNLTVTYNRNCPSRFLREAGLLDAQYYKYVIQMPNKLKNYYSKDFNKDFFKNPQLYYDEIQSLQNSSQYRELNLDPSANKTDKQPTPPKVNDDEMIIPIIDEMHFTFECDLPQEPKQNPKSSNKKETLLEIDRGSDVDNLNTEIKKELNSSTELDSKYQSYLDNLF